MMVSTLSRGGAERVAATLCNGWIERGHRVSLLCTYGGDVDLAFQLHPDVEVVYASELCRTISRLCPQYLRKLVAIRRWLRITRPDAVISFLTNVNVTAILASRGLRVPVVVSERVDPAAGVELPPALHVARALTYGFADSMVVQTPETATRLRRLLLRSPPVAVIPNPLPTSLAASERRACHNEHSKRVVAFGRLTSQKGFDRLLEAFSLAFTPESGWTLEIFGEGPERRRLEDGIADRGLTGRAFLRGTTISPWNEMADAQILALTSHYEGFPNVLMEGMALGLACVAFDCPAGPRYIAGDPPAAAIVANGDVVAFAAELRRLAGSPTARAALGAAAAIRVRRSFGEEGVFAAWDNVLRATCQSVSRRT